MNPSRKALGLVCYVAVAVWIGLYLAWSVPPRIPQPMESIARVQPLVEPPRTEAPPAAAVEPPLTAVGPAALTEGIELLDGAGDFPALTCSYEDFDSFRQYARAMVSLGARFIVVRNREIVGGVDVESGRIAEPLLEATFSPRARDYTGEPALSELTRAVRRRFGQGAVVMMIVPRNLDAGLFGGIAQALSRRGDRHGDYRELRGRYQRADSGSIRLRVDSGVRIDGTPAPIDLVFDLTEIGRLSLASAPRA